MEFGIGKNPAGFFINIRNHFYEPLDEKIAKCLDLPLLEYCEILKKHGAKLNDGEYFFQNSEQVKEVLKVLEHYIIMAKIIE